ncbi:LEAF RUST 10 DISEASE-RESISTANCE LOCUS RECEPTOR-LIKE PROTEIN KINASE-like 1.2 isoform X3 [Arachis ipaensis]|uniref:LEAF RUST 10 DISEASE-RESISTANCE LOCUS RECEPTOR-LIKE PROTEIN KINASE-like 1.2 isoform X3 n=1 Tax=Arachis ipaensis TaxID=130454 RepID=UPI000A2B94F3|nr:LEAF RUST 10 DISEASE-RESISTANCE LOCUS RECEPTOR-LIKE PROTEIN KINASE-like 1.2 isoform X3 [Arachis ipaensis]
MARPLLLPPPLPPSFVKAFVFFSSLLLPTYSAGDVKAYTDCAPFTCGTFKNISYPFWNSNQPDYCGHPRFKLDCQQDQVTINIKSQKFDVIDIDQNSQSLKIARFDLYNDPCSRDNTNVSLDNDFFKFTSNDGNITLVYDCDPPSYWSDISFKYFGMFNCSIYGGDPSAAYLVLMENLGVIFDMGCKFIIVPALAKDILSFNNYALNNGFEVGWSGVNETLCDSCKQSGGRCGHNASLNEFICFCRNNQQTYGGICSNSSLSQSPTLSAPIPSEPLSSPYPGPLNYPDHSAKGKRRKWILVVIVAAAVVGLFALAMALLFYKRRKKTSYGMSYTQPRSLSSDPSSWKDTEKGSQYFGAHLFTYTELEEATNFFDPSRELGDGGFGTVYYGQLPDGRCIAVKRLYENNYRRVEQFMNEIEILTRLRHKNLVSLFGCTSRHSRELLLVYEYIANGTVADHLHGNRAKAGTLPWHIRMNIAMETATALAYLHDSEIIHRDVKTNNILLDSNFVVKVADFGLSRLFPNNVTHVSTVPQGTPGYVDPEYHECYQLTVKSDVYSFGVVLVELISSLPAVDITRHRHEINLSTMAINKIQNQALHELVDKNLGFDSDLKVRKMINAVAELAFQCLQSSKDMRPSMQEVVDTLKDIQSDGEYKGQSHAEVMDISSTADDAVLLKDDPPPPSPASTVGSKSTTPNASG